MAENDEKGIEGRPPDPFVAARISNPGEPPAPSFQLAGLLGDSDREGFRRLYLNTSLDYYVEFRSEDVLTVEAVQPEAAPFVGLDATRVTLKRDATVNYVRSRTGPEEGFELDAQAAMAGGFGPDAGDITGTLPTDLTPTLPQSAVGGCVPADTIVNECFRTRFTCVGANCFTRQRTCFQATCRTCGDATCLTCGGATCHTCFQVTCRTCNDATCRTCGQVTCRTCNLAECWHTVVGATCIPRQCISEGIPCPTLACP